MPRTVYENLKNYGTVGLSEQRMNHLIDLLHDQFHMSTEEAVEAILTSGIRDSDSDNEALDKIEEGPIQQGPETLGVTGLRDEFSDLPRRSFDQQKADWIDWLVDHGLTRPHAERLVRGANLQPDEGAEIAWDRIVDASERLRIPLTPRAREAGNQGETPTTPSYATTGPQRAVPESPLSLGEKITGAVADTPFGAAEQVARPLLTSLQDWLTNQPQPGGVAGLFVILLVMLFAIVPTTTGYTRVHLIWLSLTGRTQLIDPTTGQPNRRAPVNIPIAPIVTTIAETVAADAAGIAGGISNAAAQEAHDIRGVIGSALGATGQMGETFLQDIGSLFNDFVTPPSTGAGASGTGTAGSF